MMIFGADNNFLRVLANSAGPWMYGGNENHAGGRVILLIPAAEQQSN